MLKKKGVPPPCSGLKQDIGPAELNESKGLRRVN